MFSWKFIKRYWLSFKLSLKLKFDWLVWKKTRIQKRFGRTFHFCQYVIFLICLEVKLLRNLFMVRRIVESKKKEHAKGVKVMKSILKWISTESLFLNNFLNSFILELWVILNCFLFAVRSQHAGPCSVSFSKIQ